MVRVSSEEMEPANPVQQPKPKRVMTAINYYRSIRTKAIRMENPDIDVRVMNKQIMSEYKSMTVQEKVDLKNKANRDEEEPELRQTQQAPERLQQQQEQIEIEAVEVEKGRKSMPERSFGTQLVDIPPPPKKTLILDKKASMAKKTKKKR